MRTLVLLPALALAILLPVACASFGADDPGAGPSLEAGTDGGSEGAADGASEVDAADAGRARKLYVFGGVTIVGVTEATVFEAFAAPILDDGSLGAWERAPMLDIGRSYMTTIATPEGPVILAGGNGVALGQGTSDDFRFYRDDVSVAGGVPLDGWKGAPPLGASNGRRAAPGTVLSGTAYLGGGIVAGDGFTNTIFAATVTATPPTTQGWQMSGALPFAMADHGLVALGSRLYVFGGSMARDGGTDLSADTFMTSVAGNMIAGWTPTGRLPKPVRGFGVGSAEGRVLVIGGEDGPASVSASVFIGVQTTSQELAWQEGAPLEQARHHPCVAHANGRFYVIGGSTLSAVLPSVEIGELSGSGVVWRTTTAMPIARSALGCVAR